MKMQAMTMTKLKLIREPNRLIDDGASDEGDPDHGIGDDEDDDDDDSTWSQDGLQSEQADIVASRQVKQR